MFPSQARRQWFNQEVFWSLLRLRGIECNAPSRLAEAFFVRKILAQLRHVWGAAPPNGGTTDCKRLKDAMSHKLVVPSGMAGRLVLGPAPCGHFAACEFIDAYF